MNRPLWFSFAIPITGILALAGIFTTSARRSYGQTVSTGASAATGQAPLQDQAKVASQLRGQTAHGRAQDQSNLPPEYPTANGPVSVVVGDFNGDGNLDLAVAATNCNPTCPSGTLGDVSILLGNGDGTFQTHVDYPVGQAPASVGVGDFNNDGKLDLAVVNGGGSISILLGNGDGTFQSAANIATNFAEGFPETIALADFNNDHNLDMAVGYPCTPQCIGGLEIGAIGIFLGNGDGTFQPEVDYGIDYVVTSIAVGDFDGNGNQDLAVGSDHSFTPGGVNILLGNGDGTFQSPVFYQGPMEAGLNSVAVGDLTPDNYLDVVGGGVVVFLGNGNGTLQNPMTYPAAPYNIAIKLADINSDGNLDVATTGGNVYAQVPYTVSTLLGNGNGTLQAPVVYPTGNGAESIASGDFNGDGKPDLVTADFTDNAVSVLLNLGNGFFAPPAFTISSSPASLTVVAGQSIPATITLTPVYGFNQAATFSCSGLPSGATCSFNPASVMPNGGAVTTALTIQIPAGLDPGVYSATVTASGGGITSSVIIPLTVEGFTLSSSASSLTVSAPGGNAQATLTVTPQQGFSQAVTFSCSGLPAHTMCTFNPLTVTPSGGALTTTLTIQTTAASLLIGDHRVEPNSPLPVGLLLLVGFAAIAGMALIGLRFAPGKNLHWAMCASIVLLAAGGMASCGGSSGGTSGGGGNSGTPTGTYTVTVTAATGGSNALTQTTPITLTVN